VVELVKAAAVGEIFWRRLSGLIFFAPLCGMAAGAAFGALEGAFRVFGIDDIFVQRVRGAVDRKLSCTGALDPAAVRKHRPAGSF